MQFVPAEPEASPGPILLGDRLGGGTSSKIVGCISSVPSRCIGVLPIQGRRVFQPNTLVLTSMHRAAIFDCARCDDPQSPQNSGGSSSVNGGQRGICAKGGMCGYRRWLSRLLLY